MKTLTDKIQSKTPVTANADYVPVQVRIAKRAFDLTLASLLLLLTLPLWPLVMLAIKLSSPGPVFFVQQRIGAADAEQFRLFDMVKFRTMVSDAEKASGPVWASKNDPRITPVGRFLRKTRLDELPQLWNVLKGEMSMIGPRPERAGIMGKLEHEIPLFNERMYGVLPGITGLAQVYQGYDETIEDSRNKLGIRSGVCGVPVGTGTLADDGPAYLPENHQRSGIGTGAVMDYY